MSRPAYPPCSECGQEPARALKGGLGQACYLRARARARGVQPRRDGPALVMLPPVRVLPEVRAALEAEAERQGVAVYSLLRSWVEERARALRGG